MQDESNRENRNGVVELDFADGTHRFRLAIGQLEELQEKTGVGPFTLLQRFMSQDWRVQDVAQTMRLGLIGGGMTPDQALSMTRRYIEQRPDWLANAARAKLVVLAALAGAPEEAPAKKKGRQRKTKTPTPNSRAAASTSEDSIRPPAP